MAATGLVAAQDPPTRIGRLNYVSGSVSFQPGGVNDWVPATINRPLTAGDQVYVNAGTFAVHVGEQAAVTGQDGMQLNMYRVRDYDDFDNWVQSRDRREDRRPSARYVSSDMVGYEDLDQYGSW